MPEQEVRFERRAIVVTGGGRGLGRAQALLLASRGARIIVADNGSAMSGAGQSEGPAQAVANEIRSAGGEAVACTADLSTEEGAVAAIEAAISAFGSIDGLIHYASTCPELTPPERLQSRDVELVVRVNSLAGIWMARAAWPHMVKQNYGRMVFTPSAAIYGAVGNTPYATAKASYIGMVRCLALEAIPHGICVNAVLPSASTRMTEGFTGAYADWLRKTMSPEQVAVAAAYLLSEDCTVNGEAFALGGGRIARVVLSEAEGICNLDSIEAVRSAMPHVIADASFFHPKDLSERSRKVAGLFGFDGGLNLSNAASTE